MVKANLRLLVGKAASGPALVLSEPLSLWGGLDAESGRIVDVHHPQHGATITDTVLVMRSGRGSSSASSVVAEAVRIGTAPAAILLLEADEIITIGMLVANELYDNAPPLGLLDPDDADLVKTGMPLTVTASHLHIGSHRDENPAE